MAKTRASRSQSQKQKQQQEKQDEQNVKNEEEMQTKKIKTNNNDGDNVLEQISKIYREHIIGTNFSIKEIMKLELEQSLEKLFWPNYIESTDGNEDWFRWKPIVMCIITMVNEKFRERATVWETFIESPSSFPNLFSTVTQLLLNDSDDITIRERTQLLVFLTHCFNSVEVELIRIEVQKYISMPIWCCLSSARLQREFERVPKLKKFWNKLEKADLKLTEEKRKQVEFERRFLSNSIEQYFRLLSSIKLEENFQQEREKIGYCERFLELLTDLEALLPTRRFFNALLDDLHVLTISRMSALYSAKNSKRGRLFSQLLDNLRFYAQFEIDDVSGEALTDSQIASLHFEKMTQLQRVSYKLFPDDQEFRPLYLTPVSSIDSREKLLKYLGPISEEKLRTLSSNLGIGLDNETVIEKVCSYFNGRITTKQIFLEVMIDRFEKKQSQLKQLNSLPLYPSEDVIWDENLVPSQYYSGDGVLALPKLNIQFLTLHDYLLRNFHLFRLESTYEIRQDIEQAVVHLKPWQAEDGSTMFGGWARMAIPIDSFAITEIGKPNIGDDKPSLVKAEVVVNLNVKRNIKHEWESLRRHDVCFLISVRPEVPPGTSYNYKEPFIPQVGLVYVRGCEIEGMLDPTGRIVDDNPYEQDRPHFETDFRTYRVQLDSNQYKIDLANGNINSEKSMKAEVIYDSFNILVRRKPKQNNFKAVLETIRDLMNTKCVVPEWLHDVILGYGEPSAANYSKLSINRELFSTLNFFDTFLDLDHVRESFSHHKIVVDSSVGSLEAIPPFKLSIDDEEMIVKVQPYKIPNRGPYVTDQPKRNAIRFTPTQVEAIRSGIQHGLTMVVGPPGTGKTDLAVQIISTLYHNHPDQRTLIVTHSNQALNAMFEKIMQLDIDERHLLRMGHGEELLETEKDFSKYGRVNYVLQKRIDLLEQVARLAETLELTSDVAYTCETAGYFYLYHVLSKWEAFLLEINKTKETNLIQEKFPFAKFFADVEGNIFSGESFEADFQVAQGCFRYIKKIFTQLDEFRAFEMLRPGTERSNYLLVREAKIIAMTCTHAALRRKELVNLMFQYDNILMEEAGQILEIETFIPLLLQNPEFGHNRLKRWIMIGDHLQLPPVIKNVSFQKFSNMEQSLFTRFVRLGVPTIYLDAQGRSKESICRLWNWRYKNLGDLKHVQQLPEYVRPNAGFQYNYQLVNVEDFNGVGETEPIPYFYQNLGEAEFVVATFMYMRLLGYPAEKITILTTYNGQKHLIRDVIEQRCATNPFIGRPAKISTVDKFQGQQNDYILLSLVRTKTVGHIRDIRRLTVAMSRARLGLYVFARESLFSQCYELQRTFNLLKEVPIQLQLIPNEDYNRENLFNRNRIMKEEKRLIKDMPEMLQFVFEFYQQRITKLQKEQPEEFKRIMNGGRIEQECESDSNHQEQLEKKIDDNGGDDGDDDNDDEIMYEPLGENDQAMDDEIELPDDDEDEQSQPKILADMDV